MNETPKNPQPEKPVAPLMRFSDALSELRADADANHEARTSGNLRGPITGLPKLDREISHALAPGLHGVYGNAGAGKTAFAMQVAMRKLLEAQPKALTEGTATAPETATATAISQDEVSPVETPNGAELGEINDLIYKVFGEEK